MKILFSKRKYNFKKEINWNISGLDLQSLKYKILNNLQDLNINDVIRFLKIFLKKYKYYSTNSFVRFLLFEIEIFENNKSDQKLRFGLIRKLSSRLKFIKSNLLKKRLIKPYNSQVYRIV